MGDRVRGLIPGAGNLCQYITSQPGHLSLVDEYQPKVGDAVLLLSSLKAGMVRLWVAGITVIP